MLFRASLEHSTDQGRGDTYWITVGGGLGDGESFEDAAHREVFEESGIRDMALGPHLWDREAVIDWQGEPFHAVERYFAARTATTDITLEHLEDNERLVFQEHRWWTPAEIADERRTETIFPQEISELVSQAIDYRTAEGATWELHVGGARASRIDATVERSC